MELFKASNQWMNRPPDERFWTVEEAATQCDQYAQKAMVVEAPYNELRVEAAGSELMLHDRKNIMTSKLTHYAFGQLCHRGNPSAPPSFLRQLPPTLAAQNVNHCLKNTEDKNANLLLHPGNGHNLLRASVSDMYSRLWNYQIFDRLVSIQGNGWRVPPARPPFGKALDPRARPATERDLLNGRTDGFLSIQVGDMISPAGIYASDHDMFCFMVNENVRTDDGLSRGFFIWNSEVGDKSFGFCTFYYNHVCGNHIVWGASGVKQITFKHVGRVQSRAFNSLKAKVVEYADASISEDQAIIKKAKTLELGMGKDQVVAALLGITRKKRIPIPQRALGAAYDIAEKNEDRYGNPNTMWAAVNGLTQYSQTLGFADERNSLDINAGKLLSLAAG